MASGVAAALLALGVWWLIRPAPFADERPQTTIPPASVPSAVRPVSGSVAAADGQPIPLSSAGPAECPAEVRAAAGQSDSDRQAGINAALDRATATAAAVLGASGNDFERTVAQMLQDPTGIRTGAVAAATSGDPRVAVLMLTICANADMAGRAECLAEPSRRWAEQQPHNLHAWLAVAQEATQRGDVPAARAAIARAVASTESHQLWGHAQRLVTSPGLERLSSTERQTLSVRMIDIETSAEMAGMSRFTSLCGEAAMQDGERQVACGAIANAMIERGRTTLEFSIALAVGRRSGWPASRVAAVEAENRRLQKALTDLLPNRPDVDRPPTEAEACEDHRLASWMLAEAAAGNEIALARRLAAKAP